LLEINNNFNNQYSVSPGMVICLDKVMTTVKTIDVSTTVPKIEVTTKKIDQIATTTVSNAL
jgi:hypothetical protein